MLGFCSFTFSAQWQSMNMGIHCMIDDFTLKNESLRIYENQTTCLTPLDNQRKHMVDNNRTQENVSVGFVLKKINKCNIRY